MAFARVNLWIATKVSGQSYNRGTEVYPNPEQPEHARLPCRVATRGFGLPNGRVATSEARLHGGVSFAKKTKSEAGQEPNRRCK